MCPWLGGLEEESSLLRRRLESPRGFGLFPESEGTTWQEVTGANAMSKEVNVRREEEK